jgi:hypothetical protein
MSFNVRKLIDRPLIVQCRQCEETGKQTFGELVISVLVAVGGSDSIEGTNLTHSLLTWRIW